MPVKVCEKCINSKIKNGENVCVVEAIKYPSFECAEHEKLCRKMNVFYESVAKKISYNVNHVLAKRKKYKAMTNDSPTTVSVNCKTALCNEKYISIVVDICVSTDSKRKERRFSQIWSVEKGDLLRTCEILKTDSKSRKLIFELILRLAKEKSASTAFGYLDGYEKRLYKNFDISKCFVVPNGICFYFDAGVLAPSKFGPASFILPFEVVEDVVKCDFCSQNSEKAHQNTDIVNNI